MLVIGLNNQFVASFLFSLSAHNEFPPPTHVTRGIDTNNSEDPQRENNN
jgi:hypothetical protein